MPQTDIGSATASNLTGAMTSFSVAPATTDGATGYGETTYQMTNWEKWLGFYKKIPELKVAVDAKSTWTVGKGIIVRSPKEKVITKTTFFCTFETLQEVKFGLNEHDEKIILLIMTRLKRNFLYKSDNEKKSKYLIKRTHSRKSAKITVKTQLFIY